MKRTKEDWIKVWYELIERYAAFETHPDPAFRELGRYLVSYYKDKIKRV